MSSQRYVQIVPTRVGPPPLPRLQYGLQDDFSVYKPAGLVSRWYAFTLDCVLSAPLDALINLTLARHLQHMAAYGHSYRYWAFRIALFLVPIMLYFVIPTWLYGQTIGKRIVGLKVVTIDWEPNLPFGAVLWRETVGKALAFVVLGLGIFMIEFNPRRRGLHDWMARTAVVNYRAG